MMNKHTIERLYKKLIEDVKTKPFYKVDLTNRINIYTCARAHFTTTIDRDAGVTPMFIQCPECQGSAHSAMYQVPDKDTRTPTLEWVRPTLEECLKMKPEGGMLDHVLNGGLELRKIK